MDRVGGRRATAWWLAVGLLAATATSLAAGGCTDVGQTSARPSGPSERVDAGPAPSSTAAERLVTGPSRLFAPPAATLVTDQATFSLRCQGTGPVPVVLVAGTGAGPERWSELIDRLGQEVLVCRFELDPADERPPGVLTPSIVGDALATLLERSAFANAVLVGHSLGGVTVRRFGARHPDLLGGALLLDPTPPRSLPSARDALAADGWDATATEADASAPADWPPVPLTVVSHDPALRTLGSDAVEALWTDGQRAYAGLAADGTATVAERSGHEIDRDRPALVIRAVDDLVGRAS